MPDDETAAPTPTRVDLGPGTRELLTTLLSQNPNSAALLRAVAADHGLDITGLQLGIDAAHLEGSTSSQET